MFSNTRYYLQFEARMGMRIYSDVAIDDFSLSPECFGLNIPPEHLQDYNYWDPRVPIDKTPHRDFENRLGMNSQSVLKQMKNISMEPNKDIFPALELGTCGARGKEGPRQENCLEYYNNTRMMTEVKVIERQPHKGFQKWRVPSENYYT